MHAHDWIIKCRLWEWETQNTQLGVIWYFISHFSTVLHTHWLHLPHMWCTIYYREIFLWFKFVTLTWTIHFHRRKSSQLVGGAVCWRTSLCFSGAGRKSSCWQSRFCGHFFPHTYIPAWGYSLCYFVGAPRPDFISEFLSLALFIIIWCMHICLPNIYTTGPVENGHYPPPPHCLAWSCTVCGSMLCWWHCSTNQADAIQR